MTMPDFAAIRANNLEQLVAQEGHIRTRALRFDDGGLIHRHSQALPGLGNLRLKGQNQPASRCVRSGRARRHTPPRALAIKR
jgi:hypothetical protein